MNPATVDDVEIELSSGNVFADLGLPDADQLKMKADLVMRIEQAVKRLGLTQAQAAARMGVAQPKVSALFRGDFSNVSEKKLLDCLTRLGYDIEIRIAPAVGSRGRFALV